MRDTLPTLAKLLAGELQPPEVTEALVVAVGPDVGGSL